MNPTTMSVGYLQLVHALIAAFGAALQWSLYLGLARRLRFFVWWAWASTLLVLEFVAAAGASLLAPRAGALSVALESIPVVAVFAAVPFVVFGVADFLDLHWTQQRRWWRPVLLAVAVALVVDAVSYVPLVAVRGPLRAAPRHAVMGLALLWCGYAFFRNRGGPARRLMTIVAAGWWLWGLNKLAYAVAEVNTVRRLSSGVGLPGSFEGGEVRLGFTLVDLALYLMLALAMVLLLVAEQRRAVRAIAEAEERYRAFVRNGMEGVWRSELDPPLDTSLEVEEQVRTLVGEARLAECNDALAAMYRFPSAAAMVGARVWAYCGQGDPRNLESLRTFVRSGYRQTQAESHETDADGRARLMLNSRLGIVADGRLVRVWGTQLDVTELARLQASLRRSETMSALGALVAGVAHEVRNPLFTMTATLDAFEARFGLREEYRKHLEVIRAQLDRLTRLMRDLLEYGKPATLDLSIGTLEASIRQAAEACEPDARAAGVLIACAFADDLPPVSGDRARLAQVFTNAIENAVQHSPAEGTVTVSTGLARERAASWVEVRVRDAGPGFSARDQPHVFEPFYTKRRGGTGLGLSLVQRIVEQHGGEVLARNHEGGGAELVVRLPVATAAPSTARGSDA